jgi:hypothetical protein
VGLHDNRGHYALAETFATSYGDAVLYGPFAGMRYPTRRIASMPRRLGIYEAELHPWLETVLGSAPRRCVNIGAADGYYAVGLAMRGLAVDAFEMSSVARGEIRDLARINGVCVNVLRRATASRLCQLDLERAVVISDCEGAELDIFDEDTRMSGRVPSISCASDLRLRICVGMQRRAIIIGARFGSFQCFPQQSERRY